MIFIIILLFLLLTGYAFIYRKQQMTGIHSVIWWVMCLLFIIIAAFRPDRMPDYGIYKEAFYGLTYDFERFEFGAQQLILGFLSMGAEFFTFLLFMATVSVTIKFVAIRKYAIYPLYSLLIYLGNIYVLHDMIQIRAAIASGMFLFALKFLSERKYWKYLLCFLLSVLFHYSSLMFLPLLFLYDSNRFNKWVYSLGILGSFALAVFGIQVAYLVQHIPIDQVQVAWNAYMYYSDSMYTKVNIFSVTNIIRITIAFLFLFNFDKLRDDKLAVLLLKVYFVSIMAFVVLSDMPVMSFRFSEFLIVSEILLIPYILKIFPNILGRSIIVLYSAFFLYLHISSGRLL